MKFQQERIKAGARLLIRVNYPLVISISFSKQCCYRGKGERGVGQTHTNGSQLFPKTITVTEFDLYFSLFVLNQLSINFWIF